MSALRKNVASQFLTFTLVNTADGSIATGKTVTGKRTIDGGVQASVTGTISEKSSSGEYELALSQADTNGNDIGFLFTATGCIPVNIHVFTTAGDPTTAAVVVDAPSVRAAVGLGSANLDTQLSTIAGYIDTEVAAILAAVDTEIATIISRIGVPAGASLAADLVVIDDFVDDLELRLTAALATKLAAHAAAVLAVVIATGSTTTTVVLSTVEGAAASAVDDFYNGAVLCFTSGALAGQRTSITDYVGATKTATVVALTGAPVNGVTAIIV